MFSKTTSKAGMLSCIQGELIVGRAQPQQPMTSLRSHVHAGSRVPTLLLYPTCGCRHRILVGNLASSPVFPAAGICMLRGSSAGGEAGESSAPWAGAREVLAAPSAEVGIPVTCRSWRVLWAPSPLAVTARGLCP